MSHAPPLHKYWFRTWIMRDYKQVERSGALNSASWENAMAIIASMAIHTWRTPLLRVELYEIAEGGELVPVSTAKERINAVLRTHRELDTGKYKNIDERKKIAVEAGYPARDIPQKRIMAPKTEKSTPVPINEWTWAARVGTYFSVRSFPVLKLDSIKSFQ